METSYKEKYEQAIERLKQWDREHPCAGYVLSDRDKFIFPELAKSEDEKVREELIKHLKEGAEGYEPAGGSSDYQRWLAWLEKQDPKKHEEELENAYKTADKVQYKRGYEDAVKEMEKQGEKHPYPYNGISFEYNGHIWGMCARDNGVDISCDKHLIKHLEKQGEQKIEENKGNIEGISPNSAWSEEDEQRLNSCLNILQPKTFVGNTETINTKWLKSLKDRVQPQPKQEWSEEDKYMYDILCGTIENTDINENTKYKLISWLKSIKGRVGCEANCTTTKEWSDDDKRKIDRIYSILRQAADTHAFSTSCRLIGDKECMELQDWLKSLRPQNHWKPSDRQMDSITCAVKKMKESVCYDSELVSLLNDLKKLKEE